MRETSEPEMLCLVIPKNHFDLLWRRCWDRDYTHNGKVFASYRKIEMACLEDGLDLCEKTEFSYSLESAFMLRSFLETHPEKLSLVRKLSRAGRFEVAGGGENISDLNMPAGECLVRNWMLGTLYTEKTIGMHQPVATVADAFGQNAQMPQILRGCEYQVVTGIGYAMVNNQYWRGLDGSSILIVRCVFPSVGSWHRLRPDPQHPRGFEQTPTTLDSFDLAPLRGRVPFCILNVGAEERLPNPDTVNYVEGLRQQYPWCQFRFGTYRELVTILEDKVSRIDCPPVDETSTDYEGNPTSTGTLVTRIRLKQRNRAAENRLLSVEKLASAAYIHKGICQSELLLDTWRKLVFTQFHDSITATHVDPAHQELLDTHAEIDLQTDQILSQSIDALTASAPGWISIFNPHSFACSERVEIQCPAETQSLAIKNPRGQNIPVAEIRNGRAEVVFHDLPPLSAVQFQVQFSKKPQINGLKAKGHKAKGREMENEFYRVHCDDRGVTSIWDKEGQRELCDSRVLRMGEPILETDIGDCWGTLDKHKDRTPLAGYGRHVATDHSPEFSRFTFSGDASDLEGQRHVYKLAWTQEVTLYRNLKRLEFCITVDWDTYNRRLRLGFPTTVDSSGKGFYEVPYGYIERDRYDQRDESRNSPCGDWPTQGWCALSQQFWDGCRFKVHRLWGVAVLNAGTPSYRVENGTVLVSVLRSPTLPTHLQDSLFGPDLYEGMRDRGQHKFVHCVTSFEGDFRESPMPNMSQALNAPPLVISGKLCDLPLPRLSAKNVVISAIKRSEDGRALVVRLSEYRGIGEKVELSIPRSFHKAQLTNLLERQGRMIAITDGQVMVELKPFQLVTIRVER